MPVFDLFKSSEQKKKEAKNESELKFFTEKRKIENQIDILKRKKKEVKKRASTASPSEEEFILLEFTRLSKELNTYEKALVKTKKLETGLRGSYTGAEPLDNILASIMVELDNLTEPEKTGGVSEKEKLRAEMNIQRKLAATPGNSGLDTFSRLSDSVHLDDDFEEAEIAEARAELFGGRTTGNEKILARMAEIEDEINS